LVASYTITDFFLFTVALVFTDITFISVFPFETFPANVGVLGIAAFDIIFIEVVSILVEFGLNAFVPIFVFYIVAVDAVTAFVVELCPNALVLVLAFYIAAVHIGKG